MPLDCTSLTLLVSMLYLFLSSAMAGLTSMTVLLIFATEVEVVTTSPSWLVVVVYSWLLMTAGMSTVCSRSTFLLCLV